MTKEEKGGAVNPVTDEVTISGVTNATAKTYLIFSDFLHFLKEGAFLWLVRDEKEKEEIIGNLKFWLSFFKEKRLVFDLEEKNGLLLSAINKAFSVATPEDLSAKWPTREQWRKKILVLKNKQLMGPAGLCQKLTLLGYEFQQFASNPGLFSRRGGIVDIYPPDFAHPLKVEFSGPQIDNLSYLDINTKKILEKTDQAEIIPFKLDALPGSAELFDYLNRKKTLFIYSDPESFEQSHPHWQEITEKIKNYKSLVFESFVKGKAGALDFKPARNYAGDLKALCQDLKKYQGQKIKIIIATQRKNDILELFREKKITGPVVFFGLPNKNIRGFFSREKKVAFLTDREIFGEIIKEERKRMISPELIYELRPNDFIVHLDHGIARFKGISRQKTDGQEKEYFCLEYAESDKLYLPVEYAEKISKYIGEAKPKLHRLSGTSWRQLTQKIKKSAEKTAHELLKIYALRETACATPLKEYPAEEKELEASFAFEETDDQEKAINEALTDLSGERPTDRLICGDVGFGKTEVAVRAAFRAVLNKKQVALLTPTTLLTQQHYDTFKARLRSFPVNIALLSRVDSQKRQKEIISLLKNGLVDIVIGTHRLLSGDVEFKDLGLIIIDEEQRFGVKDKEKLKAWRSQAHILTLSATPIPRTLNFSLAGLRDVSVIKTPPRGRQTIETVITPYSEEIIKKAILAEIKRKGQVYYLHNRVETINLKANHLKRLIPKAKIGVIHGRLPEKELMEEMKKFDNLKTNLLVCSTIIENGLDLPHANTLIVENATRFGLADLYQLRGRIGRSYKKAFSYFLYHSEKLKFTARKRLQALLEAKELGSGFELALRDLEIRGSGNILGHRQSGHIKAIGLNFYLRLLNQSMEEIKTGEPQKPIRDVQIDLPLSLGIPQEIIPEEAKRLKMYQEMANIINERELKDYEEKFQKKYEYLPERVKNLFTVLGLKIIAQKTPIISISSLKTTREGKEKEKIIINFLEVIKPEQIEKLLKINPDWDFSQEQIKIDKLALGEKWLPKLTECVRVFV